MDIKRIALFASLGVISYLMLQQWNQDYNQPSTQVSSRVTTTTTSDMPVSGNTGTTSTNSAVGDIPVSATASDASLPTSVAAVNSNPEGYINIKTDTLDIQVNLIGGDIEYLALPAYPLTIDTPDQPFVILENNFNRHFIAQSGLVGVNGPDAQATRPMYRTNQTDFEMTGDTLNVDLFFEQDGVRYTKTYGFSRGLYVIDVSYTIENNGPSDWTGALFGQLKRDQSKDPTSSGGIGLASALAFARTTADTRYEKIAFDDIDDGVDNFANTGGWIAFIQHYFVSAWIPNKTDENTYYLKTANNNQYRGGFSTPAITVAPGSSGTVTASFYSGPKNQPRLAVVAENLDLSVDYGWLWWAAQPIFWLLTKIQSVVVNWGWSIILLTLTIKTLFSPLTAASARSMARMRKFSPKMTQLREQYGDDKNRMSQELMKLYKKEKINPMGGCLPMIVQMPVFIALYWVLMEAVELRQSPWIFWIHDLSLKDPYFVLPILMAASMAFQMSLTAQPNMDPMQAKMMKMMPWVFGVMFLWFPSGLVLYWLVNNLISIAQQWYFNREVAEAPEHGSGSK